MLYVLYPSRYLSLEPWSTRCPRKVTSRLEKLVFSIISGLKSGSKSCNKTSFFVVSNWNTTFDCCFDITVSPVLHSRLIISALTGTKQVDKTQRMTREVLTILASQLILNPPCLGLQWIPGYKIISEKLNLIIAVTYATSAICSDS